MSLKQKTLVRKFVRRHKDRVRRTIRNPVVSKALSWLFGSNLSTLAMLFETDKLEHGYIPAYESLLGGLQNKRFNLLEIGIGGFEGFTVGGESLRMWKAYFPHARIHGLDIEDRSAVAENRIAVWQGSQIDPEILARIHAAAGGFDVMIDDGSHRSEHIIATFQILFPRLNRGGLYFVEDTQTSYWPEFGGKAVEHDATDQTTMGYFKRMTDRLNAAEYRFDHTPTEFDAAIDSIFFWHNLIAIRKR